MSKRKLPNFIRIGDDIFKPMVLLINTRDQHGRPKLCTIIHEEEEVHLAGGEEFMVGYGLKKTLSKKK